MHTRESSSMKLSYLRQKTAVLSLASGSIGPTTSGEGPELAPPLPAGAAPVTEADDAVGTAEVAPVPLRNEPEPRRRPNQRSTGVRSVKVTVKVEVQKPPYYLAPL